MSAPDLRTQEEEGEEELRGKVISLESAWRKSRMILITRIPWKKKEKRIQRQRVTTRILGHSGGLRYP